MSQATPASGRWPEVLRAFFKLGLTSFGGPVAHLGYFRGEFVARRAWLAEPAYSAKGAPRVAPRAQDRPNLIYTPSTSSGPGPRVGRLVAANHHSSPPEAAAVKRTLKRFCMARRDEPGPIAVARPDRRGRLCQSRGPAG